MRVSTSVRRLGDATRHLAHVTDGKALSATAVIDGADAIAALETLELQLGEAIAAVREQIAKLMQEAA